MKKAFILLFILTKLVFNEYLFGQNYLSNYKNTPEYLNANSNWLRHSNIRLQFTQKSDTPRLLSINLNDTNFFEGCLSFSNPINGELELFSRLQTSTSYSIRLINKNEEFMINGDSIGASKSVRQAYAVIPVAKNPEQYYIFSLEHDNTPEANQLFLSYSIVDMNLDNGNGGIVSNKKNLALRDFRNLDSIADLSEAIVAIPGNNCNTWLIAKSGKMQNDKNVVKYFIFEINENGIQEPKVFHSNSTYGNTSQASFHQLKVSPDRTKLVSSYLPMVNYDIFTPMELEFLTFDPETGSLSKSIVLNDTLLNNDYFFTHLTHVDFSPNSQVLYISRKNKIFKLDVSKMEKNNIQTSLKKAIELDNSIEIRSMNTYGNNIYIATDSHLHIIANPNDLSSTIIMKNNILSFPINLNEIGPYFLNAVTFPYDVNITPSIIPISICEQTEKIITLTARIQETGIALDQYEILWNTGATGSSIEVTITDTNSYWVQTTRFVDGCRKVYIDTFKLSKEGMEAPFIQVNENSLSVEDVYASYQWYRDNQILAGENNHTLNVTANGEYKVTVTNKVGCEATTDPYVVNNHTSTNDLDNYGLTIYPNPTQNLLYIQSNISVDYQLTDVSGRILKSGEQATMISLKELANGIYKLLIYQEGKLITTQKVIKQN